MELPSSISTRLQYQHKSLIDIIDGLTDEQIRMHIQPGKWSIFENIVHLQTYQHAMIIRIKALLDGNEPVFERYAAESDPLFRENVSKSSREIMQDLLTTRKEMCSGLLSFPENDFQKTGTHPVYGKMNMIQWLNFFLLHEAHHLFTIFKLSCGLREKS